MITKLIAGMVGLMVVIVVLVGIWFFFFASKPTSQIQNLGTTTLPSSSSITPVGSGTQAGVTPTFPITNQLGTVLSALDFIHNGTTIPDTANTGRYLLAGNLGYCSSKPQECQAAHAANFTIYFNSGPQSFTINLTQEPIGQARLDMEQFMLKTLGLSQAQFCSLKYFIGVTTDVNSTFAGKNLGFSFCPGATTLPK